MISTSVKPPSSPSTGLVARTYTLLGIGLGKPFLYSLDEMTGAARWARSPGAAPGAVPRARACAPATAAARRAAARPARRAEHVALRLAVEQLEELVALDRLAAQKDLR